MFAPHRPTEPALAKIGEYRQRYITRWVWVVLIFCYVVNAESLAIRVTQYQDLLVSILKMTHPSKHLAHMQRGRGTF